jgi:GNAT superfamily N-acetyltransferase
MATARRLMPDAGVDGMEIAGGLAAFTGADSPLSQVYGIVEPVTAEDVATITAFYETRGAIPRVFVSPLADASLASALAAAGYAPCEYENVLASDSFDAAASDERIGIATDRSAWAVASAKAFTGVDTVGPADLAIAHIIAFSDGVYATEARDDGTIVATAAMDVKDGCAGLFAGSTLPAYRGRGWQLAMIRDRVARARDRGARLMRAHARTTSVSERNFIRCGFQALYTRALWERQRRD